MTIFMINLPKAVTPSTGGEPSLQTASPDAAPNVAKPGEQPGKMDDDLQAARKLDQDDGKTEKGASGQTKEREERLISIDGPVSRIYSAALQEVFANEGMAAMLHDYTDAESGVGIDGEPIVKDGDMHQSVAGFMHTKVYSYTADTINLQEVVKINNEISRSKGRNYIVAVEGIDRGSIGRAAELLGDMEKAGQIKLCLSRSSAMSAIMSSLKS